MSKRKNHRADLSILSGILCLLALAFVACNQPPAVNPWVDDSIHADSWSTPSRDEILAKQATPTVHTCETPMIDAPYVSPKVPHYPLWWEDPFEDKGDGDTTFAWTWQDYLAMPYCFGRYLLNTMAWPVSASVTLPGTSMVSDGVVGRDHDAAPGNSPDPTATQTDFGYTQNDDLPCIIEATETANSP